MPKVKPKSVRTQTHAASNSDPAAGLIDAVRFGVSKPLPSVEALSALQKLIKYNDAAEGPTKRVGSQSAIDMLQTHYGWKGTSISALNALCRRAFGRKSWGTP